MPRSRAYWKGFLRLSLVTIGVHVHNAVESKSEISFRQIHKPTGRRVNYQKTASGVGVIENADIVKGYEVGKDQYVLLEPEEIDAIKLESKRTIDLVQFVDANDYVLLNIVAISSGRTFSCPVTRWPARATPSFATRSGRLGRSASGRSRFQGASGSLRLRHSKTGS
jgi:Ku70/Ku80 beta-barrel domain